MVFVFNTPMPHYILAAYFSIFKAIVGQVKCCFLAVDILFGFCIKYIRRTMYLHNRFDIGSPIIVQNKIIKASLIDCSSPVGNAAMRTLGFLLIAVTRGQRLYQALHIFE